MTTKVEKVRYDRDTGMELHWNNIVYHALALGIPAGSVKAMLDRQIEAGEVEQVGEKGDGRYVLLRPLRP